VNQSDVREKRGHDGTKRLAMKDTKFTKVWGFYFVIFVFFPLKA